METALVLIDLQRGYFENPVLAREEADVVAAANALRALGRERGMPTYIVVTEHDRDKSTWTLSMRDDDQGFMFVGSEQAQSLPGLDTTDAHRVVKIRDSAFHGTDLAQRLRIGGIKRLVLAGVSGQNCVARTGADAFALDFRVAYAMDAIASTDPELGSQALNLVGIEQRQDLLSLDEIRSWVR
jgi:nicotinamidase-related amidase